MTTLPRIEGNILFKVTAIIIRQEIQLFIQYLLTPIMDNRTKRSEEDRQNSHDDQTGICHEKTLRGSCFPPSGIFCCFIDSYVQNLRYIVVHDFSLAPYSEITSLISLSWSSSFVLVVYDWPIRCRQVTPNVYDSFRLYTTVKKTGIK